MLCSYFESISSVKKAFGLSTVEGKRLLSQLPPVVPTQALVDSLEQHTALSLKQRGFYSFRHLALC